MTLRSLGFALAFFPAMLAAQPLRQHANVPLNNWPAPARWPRPAPAPEQRILSPKFQLPGDAAADVLVFVPLAPCRLADTRPGSGYPALGSTPLATLTPRTLPVAGSCQTPSSAVAEAYSLNVTVVPPGGTPGGYLVVYPNPATPVPLVASLTWNPSAAYQTGAVTAAASADGSVNVVARLATDVVVDINGYYAAPSNTAGDTGLGTGALAAGAAGSRNTALGYMAMHADLTGDANTALGFFALTASTNGSNNAALGYQALGNSTTGSDNTGLGIAALFSTTGVGNIGLGSHAGTSLTTGSYNIMVGNQGTSTDDHTIRIGDVPTSANVQTATYIAGILGNNLTSASPVVINANGQLGVQPLAGSSRRYKEDIQDMGEASAGLLRLRPVTFHYKKPDADGSKPLEYGLIAEEVNEVYPELVIRGEDGRMESVAYQKLPAMLLNELQKQCATIRQQREQLAQQREQFEEQSRKLEARIAALEALARTSSEMPPKGLTAPAGGR